ncbi:hypothetical protein B1R32_11227 [Abditibacterium utsteinense]|uniref:PH domain-containing protein n=2 Tax=Abditibacterium utsteinense TaxID=1960156 RepID=A0A2S8SRC9_9BACT|nr:hypothetical protein B1R32_11227 [Abditibacterium utsteinense]
MLWQNGETRIEASWDEVRAVHSLPGRGFKHDYRVETQNGDFTVWKELEYLGLWIGLVRQFAPHLSIETSVVDPDLGSEAATWSGGQIGNGARVFHFRTRNARLALWAATTFVVIVPLLPLLMHAMKTSDDDPSPTPWKFWLAVLILGVLVMSYLWLCFKRAAIGANETALEWRIPFLKTRRVRWSEIESFGRDEWGFFIQTSAKKRKLWQISAPVRQSELLQLIAERATNASEKWD